MSGAEAIAPVRVLWGRMHVACHGACELRTFAAVSSLLHRLRFIPYELKRQTSRYHLDVRACVCLISSNCAWVKAEKGPVVFHAQIILLDSA